MKVAILIMAHHQPEHLALLVQSLKCDWIHFFIHIDKKVDMAEFLRLVPKQRNIHFLNIEQRVKVNWGGYSQVKAILNLLTAALNFPEHFDRFSLLSGSDFPIKSLSHIKDRFDTKQEFMRVDRRLEDFDTNSHYKFVRYFYFMDYSLMRKIGLSGRIPRKVYPNLSLYHGSTWWSLTRECVEYIMNFLRNNESYKNFHRWTLSPDEIFFHSIVKSSPFASNITHDFEKVTSLTDYFKLNEHGCTYIDWNAKNVHLPKIMTLEDDENLVNSSSLFARKFDHDQSADLINKFCTDDTPFPLKH